MFPLKHYSAYSLLLSLRLKLLNGKKIFSQHFFTFIRLLPKSILLQNLITAILFILLSLFTLLPFGDHWSKSTPRDSPQFQTAKTDPQILCLWHKKRKEKLLKSHTAGLIEKRLSESTSTINEYIGGCNDTNIRTRAHSLPLTSKKLSFSWPGNAMVIGVCRIWWEWLGCSKTNSEDTKGSQYLISEQF